MANPRAEEKKEEKAAERKDYLGPIKSNIASILRSAGTDAKKTAYLEVLKGPLDAAGQPDPARPPALCGVAHKALNDVTEAGASLGRDTLKGLIPSNVAGPGRYENPALEAAWTASQNTLLNEAKNHLDAMNNHAYEEVKQLFNVPPAREFKEEKWGEIFQKSIDDFKVSIQVQRDAVMAAKAAALLAGPPPDAEKVKIEARSTEQLNALNALEKHYVEKVQHQRDTAVYKAMTNGKFHDPAMPLGAQNVGAQGNLLNPGEELTLAEHASRLRWSNRLKNFLELTRERTFWDSYDEADFIKNGYALGRYKTNLGKTRFTNYFSGLGFEITPEGIEIKKNFSGLGNNVKNYDSLLELLHGMEGLPQRTLWIAKDTSISIVQTFADAVSNRQKDAQGNDLPPDAPRNPPTLVLTDESIKHLLKQEHSVLRGYKPKNSPDDIAKVYVQLQGLKEGDVGYADKLTAAKERVDRLAVDARRELKQEANTKPVPQEQKEARDPAARGRRR